MKLLIDIDVPDLAPALKFYCSAFDLRLTRMLDDDVAELVGGSSVIYLLKKNSGSKCASAVVKGRQYSRHWTPVHLDFVVDNIEQAAARVIMAGAARETECIHWRGSKCITFSDPFGNGFCLIAFDNETYSDASTQQ